MGGCQNYAPFLDPCSNTALGHPERDHDFDNHPHLAVFCSHLKISSMLPGQGQACQSLADPCRAQGACFRKFTCHGGHSHSTSDELLKILNGRDVRCLSEGCQSLKGVHRRMGDSSLSGSCGGSRMPPNLGSSLVKHSHSLGGMSSTSASSKVSCFEAGFRWRKLA